MGQVTQAIMFGVQRPEGLYLFDDDADDGGIGQRWEGECGPQIKAASDALEQQHPNAPWEWRADHLFVPGADESFAVIGLWVAVGASGRPGVPSLDGAVALDAIDVTEPYASALRLARERWEAFAAWAATQGLALPAAKLWLVETEVA